VRGRNVFKLPSCRGAQKGRTLPSKRNDVKVGGKEGKKGQAKEKEGEFQQERE